MSSAWVEIRCPSASCTDPRGRVLFSSRDGWFCTTKRKGQGVIARGLPAVVICRCGYVWRNPDVAERPEEYLAFASRE